jgi:hypothetical protein
MSTALLAASGTSKSICHLGPAWCQAFDLLKDPTEEHDLNLTDSKRSGGLIGPFEAYMALRAQQANYRVLSGKRPAK